MSFSCLLPVRDEADIVGQCLQHLLEWADAIFVFLVSISTLISPLNARPCAKGMRIVTGALFPRVFLGYAMAHLTMRPVLGIAWPISTRWKTPFF